MPSPGLTKSLFAAVAAVRLDNRMRVSDDREQAEDVEDEYLQNIPPLEPAGVSSAPPPPSGPEEEEILSPLRSSPPCQTAVSRACRSAISTLADLRYDPARPAAPCVLLVWTAAFLASASLGVLSALLALFVRAEGRAESARLSPAGWKARCYFSTFTLHRAPVPCHTCGGFARSDG